MEKMSFFIGKENHKKLKEICKEKEIKMGEAIRHLIGEYIEKYEKQIKIK